MSPKTWCEGRRAPSRIRPRNDAGSSIKVGRALGADFDAMSWCTREMTRWLLMLDAEGRRAGSLAIIDLTSEVRASEPQAMGAQGEESPPPSEGVRREVSLSVTGELTPR